MKIVIASAALCLYSASAFSVKPLFPVAKSLVASSPLYSTAEAPSDVDEDETSTDIAPAMDLETAKANLLTVAQSLHDEHGIVLVDKASKTSLKEAVASLEEATGGDLWAPMGWPEVLDVYTGDWTLLVATLTPGASTSEEVKPLEEPDQATWESKYLPKFLVDPLDKIRGTILETSNKYLVVQQKIKMTKDDGVVDRIDHTLELEPPKQLQDVLDNLPESLQTVNINPLSVSKSKLVLIHKADILDGPNEAKTKISLESLVLNVAGTSQVLDPNGKDLAGINIPNLGEFLNTADFETTYCDEGLRISRGKIELPQGRSVEQLRVFVRTEPPTLKVDIESELSEEEEIVDIEAGIADVSVEAIASPDDDVKPSDVEEEDDDGEDEFYMSP